MATPMVPAHTFPGSAWGQLPSGCAWKASVPVHPPGHWCLGGVGVCCPGASLGGSSWPHPGSAPAPALGSIRLRLPHCHRAAPRHPERWPCSVATVGLSPGQSSGSPCAGAVQQGARPWQLGDGSGPGQVGECQPLHTWVSEEAPQSLFGSEAAFGQNTEWDVCLEQMLAVSGGVCLRLHLESGTQGWISAPASAVEQLGAKSKRECRQGLWPGENQGPWSWETCFGHRECTPEPAPVHPSSSLPQRGAGWPCRSVATMGLLGQWAGTLNNSAGTTGREGTGHGADAASPQVAPLPPWQWPL